MNLSTRTFYTTVCLIQVASMGVGFAGEQPAEAAGEAALEVSADSFDTTTEGGLLSQFFGEIKRGLRLQRLPGPGETELGADLSFFKNHETGDDTVLNADFFLAWNSEPRFNLEETAQYRFELSIEGHFNSEVDDRQDAWVFRGGGIIETGSPKRGLYTSLMVKDETDRDFETHRLSAELMITPTMDSLALGRYQSFFFTPDEWLRWRWRPFLTIDGGGVINNDGGDGVLKDSHFQAELRTALSFEFPGLANTFGFEEVTLSANHHLFFISEDSETYDYLTVTAELMLTENIGLNLNYNSGRNAPGFVREETFSGGLSVRF
ncbi:MAG: hypothetical protein AAF591_22940 [Verrucomicrobiota bacterium]